MRRSNDKSYYWQLTSGILCLQVNITVMVSHMHSIKAASAHKLVTDFDQVARSHNAKDKSTISTLSHFLVRNSYLSAFFFNEVSSCMPEDSLLVESQNDGTNAPVHVLPGDHHSCHA